MSSLRNRETEEAEVRVECARVRNGRHEGGLAPGFGWGDS